MHELGGTGAGLETRDPPRKWPHHGCQRPNSTGLGGGSRGAIEAAPDERIAKQDTAEMRQGGPHRMSWELDTVAGRRE